MKRRVLSMFKETLLEWADVTKSQACKEKKSGDNDEFNDGAALFCSRKFVPRKNIVISLRYNASFVGNAII